jgi:hypothetical protein
VSGHEADRRSALFLGCARGVPGNRTRCLLVRRQGRCGRHGPHLPRDEPAATARRDDLRPALVGRVFGPDGGREGQRGNSGASASANRDRLDRVYSSCGGNTVGEDLVMDRSGEWSVQWDTQSCSNGQQTLDTWAFRGGTALGNATITVQLSNSSPRPPDPGPTACEPSAKPEPLAGQGCSPRFSDCFDTLSRSVWCSNQWWEPPPPVGTQYVQGGVLHLVRRRSDGYPNVTVSSEPCGQANPQSFRRGYFEARLRWTGVPGSGPAVWLFSTAHATNPKWPRPACPEPRCLAAEIDVFEGSGTTATSSPARSTAIRPAATAYRISSTRTTGSPRPAWTCLAGMSTQPGRRARP